MVRAHENDDAADQLCKLGDGCHGYIDWDESLAAEGGGQAPPSYRVGRCIGCSSLHIECGNCGELDYHPESSGEVECQGCGARWRITSSHDPRNPSDVLVEQIKAGS